MKAISLILPLIFISVTAYAVFKKVKVYDSFAVGASKAIPLTVSLFPYLLTIFVMTELFKVSGVSDKLINFLSPVFAIFGIPKEIVPLVVLKPFSGSGSIATLNEIMTTYGVDSYLSRLSCTVFGSSETVFYISAVYYSKSKEKRLTKPIIISLTSTFISTVFACLIVKIL